MKSLECLGNGYEEVDKIECTDQCYSFDNFGIIRGPDGRLWFGNTSGCSCPGEWHEYEYDPETHDTTLSPLNAQTMTDFERQVAAWDGKVDPEERRRFVENGKALATKAGFSPRTQ